MSQRQRRCRGSAISETGPALFLLFIIIVFPMIDLLALAAGYVMSGIYHDHMTRELALSAPPGVAPDPAIQSQATAIQKINTEFQNSSFYNFLKMSPSDLSVSNIQYLPSPSNPNIVQCTTRCLVRPFINIPWWDQVPGLNAPFPFTQTSQRAQEEKGRN